MTYQQIKHGLRIASEALDAGNVAAADTMIRAMVGQGLTRADLDANLTPAQIGILRLHKDPRASHCKRCGHRWRRRSRDAYPTKCSSCGSPDWDRSAHDKVGAP